MGSVHPDDAHAPAARRGPERLVAWLLAAICFGLILRCAWLCDDAFITLRTVDNVVRGDGLTWNPDERVQAYTHPLWMGLLCVPYTVSREPYLATLGLSLSASALFLVLFVRSHVSGLAAGAAALVGLAVSKAFVDYSTSGLENPLTHVLLCVAYALHWRSGPTPRALFWLALLAALGTLNRLDAALLFLPPLVVTARRVVREAGWRTALARLGAGASPLVAWELFSLVYYGLLVPNTAYAKLNTGVATSAYLLQGWRYLAATARADPATVLVVALGLALALRPSGRHLRVAAGAILLHLAYVVWIGGDFMVGRLWTAPLVLACAIVARSALGARAGGAIVAVLLALGLWLPTSPLRAGADYGPERVRKTYGHGISDERATYYPSTGLFRAGGGGADHAWAEQGKQARRRAEAMATPPTVVWGTVGMVGYYAGPRVKVIDEFALADPLLARLPIPDARRWRIGHFRRDLPDGYLETRASGENRIADPDLAAYYDRLALVVSGDLWSAERLRAIAELLTGRHDHRLEAYAARLAGRAR